MTGNFSAGKNEKNLGRAPAAWLAMKLFDWIAKRRGKPTSGEMDEVIQGSLELSNFKARYSEKAWDKILDKNPDLRRMLKELANKASTSEHGKKLSEVLEWLHENEDRLQK